MLMLTSRFPINYNEITYATAQQELLPGSTRCCSVAAGKFVTPCRSVRRFCDNLNLNSSSISRIKLDQFFMRALQHHGVPIVVDCLWVDFVGVFIILFDLLFDSQCSAQWVNGWYVAMEISVPMVCVVFVFILYPLFFVFASWLISDLNWISSIIWTVCDTPLGDEKNGQPAPFHISSIDLWGAMVCALGFRKSTKTRETSINYKAANKRIKNEDEGKNANRIVSCLPFSRFFYLPLCVYVCVCHFFFSPFCFASHKADIQSSGRL